MALAALTTAGWAAVVGAAPVVAVALVAWIADSRSTAPAVDAVRIGLNAWLLAHGAWLHTPGGLFGLMPLALSALAFRQLARAGGNSARATGIATVGGGVRVAIWLGIVYGSVGALVSMLAATKGVWADVPTAAGATAGFAMLAGAVGIVRVNGIGGLLLRRLPSPLRRALPVGAIAAATVLGAGALVAGACVALAGEQTAVLFTAFSPGLVGSASLLGLSVVYAPTAAIWAAAYLVGPGFSVGAGTSVSAIDVSLGPLPAVPLFAALPTDRASVAASLLLGVPLLAGILGGAVAARRRAQGERWALTLTGAALGGPVAGVLLGIAAYLAGGPLGDGRLAAVGPSPWRVALVSAVEITLFAVVGTAGARIAYVISGRVPLPVRGVSSEPEVDLDPIEDPDDEPTSELAAERDDTVPKQGGAEPAAEPDSAEPGEGEAAGVAPAGTAPAGTAPAGAAAVRAEASAPPY